MFIIIAYHLPITFNRYWSQAGCIIIEKGISHVTCSCDHMTSFAVLMQLVDVSIPQFRFLTFFLYNILKRGVLACTHLQRGMFLPWIKSQSKNSKSSVKESSSHRLLSIFIFKIYNRTFWSKNHVQRLTTGKIGREYYFYAIAMKFLG